MAFEGGYVDSDAVLVRCGDVLDVVFGRLRVAWTSALFVDKLKVCVGGVSVAEALEDLTPLWVYAESAIAVEFYEHVNDWFE